MGLDWSDADPGGGFVPVLSSWKVSHGPAGSSAPGTVPLVAPSGSARFVVGTILAGMCLAIGFGLYMLHSQRQLFLAYGELDRLAETRAAELISAHSALLPSEKMKALGILRWRRARV